MRYIYAAIGVIASLILLTVSAGMNYRFGYQLGSLETDSLLLGIGSVAIDLMKSVLPFFIGYAAIRKNRSAVLAGLVMMGLFTLYSLTSAIGFSSSNRAETTGKRTIAATAYSDLRKEIKRVENRLKRLGDFEPVEVITARLESLKVNRRWKSSKSCTNATASASRDFCKRYKKEQGNLGLARSGTKLEAQLVKLKRKLAGFKDASVVSAADPQAKALAFFTGIEIEWVKYMLIGLVALVCEIGSGLGLYMSLHHFGRYKGEQETPAMRPQYQEKGRVALFCKECLSGSPEGEGLTIFEMYNHYLDWCEQKSLATEDYNNFSLYFQEVAKILELEMNDDRYLGVVFKAANENQLMIEATVA